jgi:hypothetical protein
MSSLILLTLVASSTPGDWSGREARSLEAQPSVLLDRALAAAGDLDAPRPSNGVGLLVTGGILTGLGVLNLGTAPICRADFYRDYVGQNGSDVCFVMSLVLGGTMLVVGLPLLIAGKTKRDKYKAWLETHGQPVLMVLPTGDGALAGWRLGL